MTEVKKTRNAIKTAPRASSSVKSQDKELEALKKKQTKEIADLKKKQSEEIKTLTDQVKSLRELLESQQKDSKKVKKVSIDPEEDIDVISLCPTKLNLSTDGFGAGNTYRFTEFGEVQPIPFRDLKDIVRNQKGFLKKGYFYIDNEDAIAAMSVSKICENLPKKEVLLFLLEKDSQSIIKVLDMLPKGLLEMFAILIEKKIENSESIDMNVVATCGKLLNRDLVEEVKNRKELMSGGE